MREQFDKDLATLRQDLVHVYADVDLQLHEAMDALIHEDKDKAKKVRRATHKIDQASMKLEERAYNLIVLQNPVASDLRLLQFIIYVNFNIQRMSNHVRNIAKTAERAAGHAVPGGMLELLASLAHLVYRVLGETVRAIVENDLNTATNLPELDEPVDALYRTFFKTFSKLKTDDDIEAASRVMMAARMLERISDNSVEVGDRLVFLLTGRRATLDDLQELEPEELDDLQAAQGLALTMGQKEVVRAANQIPEVELASPTAKAEASAEADDDDDDYDDD